MSITKINVPLDKLQPGDSVHINAPATVEAVSGYMVTLRWPGGRWIHLLSGLETHGATATREVEPEFNLTWAEALNQVVTHGKMCKPDCEDCRYRYVEGVWRAYSSLSDDRWVEILLHLSTPAQRRLTKAKWRIEDENG